MFTIVFSGSLKSLLVGRLSEPTLGLLFGETLARRANLRLLKRCLHTTAVLQQGKQRNIVVADFLRTR